MKIKGLGPKSIEKLELTDVPEIYALEEVELTEVLGKVGETIFKNIQASKRIDFSTFLASLSIPLIGQTVSKKIGEFSNSLTALDDLLLSKAGVGEKARSNLLQWLENYVEIFSSLPIVFDPIKVGVKKVELGKVCITGKLADFSNRTQAKACLEELGYKVVGTISKTLDYLVDEQDSKSSKNTKAKDLNIPITSMQHLIKAAGENNNV
jgi:DNA ligase (NAD+)